jgi:hypothetical protein
MREKAGRSCLSSFTSVEAEVAFAALRFMKAGGTFVPAYALSGSSRKANSRSRFPRARAAEATPTDAPRSFRRYAFVLGPLYSRFRICGSVHEWRLSVAKFNISDKFSRPCRSRGYGWHNLSPKLTRKISSAMAAFHPEPTPGAGTKR